MARKLTNEEVAALPLVGYERTRAEAVELAREFYDSTGRKCIVINRTGTRGKRNSGNEPWQVRERKTP